MMTLRQRITARMLYQRWFYAPQCTGRYAATQLVDLGFTWDGRRWQPPSVQAFLYSIATGRRGAA